MNMRQATKKREQMTEQQQQKKILEENDEVTNEDVKKGLLNKGEILQKERNNT